MARLSFLGDRMIRAAKLDRGLYEEVEADTGATGQSILVVVLSSVAAGIGSAGGGGLKELLFGALSALVAWYIWASITYFIGTRLLPESQTEADVGQLLRILELAWTVANIGHPSGTHGNRVSGMHRLDAGRHGHCRPAGARLSRHRKSNRRLPDRLAGPSGDYCRSHDVSGHWSGTSTMIICASVRRSAGSLLLVWSRVGR